MVVDQLLNVGVDVVNGLEQSNAADIGRNFMIGVPLPFESDSDFVQKTGVCARDITPDAAYFTFQFSDNIALFHDSSLR